MKIKLPSYINLILKIVVSGAMLWYVFSQFNFIDVLKRLGNANMLWMFVALLFFILSKLISAYRLNTFFKDAGLQISDGYNIRLYLLGMFYNLFLPGGIGGDAYKIYLLNKQEKVKAKDLFWATLLDRVTGLIALFILTIVLLYFVPLPSPIHQLMWILIPLTLLVSYFVIKKFFNRYTSSYIKTNLQSFGVQMSQVVSAFFILLALGFTKDIPLFLTIFLISSIVSVIPFTLGGAGAREFTFTLMSSFLAFEAEDADIAIALGLGFYVITLITSTIGIYYYFFPKKLTMQN